MSNCSCHTCWTQTVECFLQSPIRMNKSISRQINLYHNWAYLEIWLFLIDWFNFSPVVVHVAVVGGHPSIKQCYRQNEISLTKSHFSCCTTGGGDMDLSLSLCELLMRASVYVGTVGVLPLPLVVVVEYSITEDHLLFLSGAGAEENITLLLLQSWISCWQIFSTK